MAEPSRGRSVVARLMICAIALALLCGAGCRGATKKKPATKPSQRQAALTPEQRQKNVESFDHVWKTIRDAHWDPSLGGLDWEAVRAELRPKVEQAGTTAEARHVMQEMIGRLKQSHFGIIPASVYDEVDAKGDGAAAAAGTQPAAKKKGDGTIGADVRLVDGKVIVTHVDPQLPAAKAGVKPGWSVEAVDGRAVAPLVTKLRENLPDNNMKHATLTASLAALLHGPIGETAKFRFHDGRGKRVTETLAFAQPSGTKAVFGNLPAFYVDFESRRLEPGNIGYVAFKPFFDPQMVMRRFGEAMDGFRDADGIILDLRGNPGGIGAMAMGVGNYFVDDADQRLGTMKLRAAEINFVLNPRAEVYEGPLAILVDEMSMSTSEILAGGLQDLKRARVFGTPTPGAALPSTVERLPNGDGFQYAFANYTSAGGQPLEGRGVTPDETVKLDRGSLLQGRDPVVEAAVRWIQSQPKRKMTS